MRKRKIIGGKNSNYFSNALEWCYHNKFHRQHSYNQSNRAFISKEGTIHVDPNLLPPWPYFNLSRKNPRKSKLSDLIWGLSVLKMLILPMLQYRMWLLKVANIAVTSNQKSCYKVIVQLKIMLQNDCGGIQYTIQQVNCSHSCHAGQVKIQNLLVGSLFLELHKTFENTYFNNYGVSRTWLKCAMVNS